MHGQYHPLTKKTGFSKVVWGLTSPQIVAILIGGKLSYEMAQLVPPLPIKNPVFAHIHQLIPLFGIAGLLYIREQRTGLLLYQYIFLWIRFKLRREKVFVWKRV